jgi:hypothetical protein
VNFVVCGLDSFLLTQEALTVSAPQVANIKAKRCPLSVPERRKPNRAQFCTGGEDPTEPGTVLAGLNDFRPCPAANHPVGGKGLWEHKITQEKEKKAKNR